MTVYIMEYYFEDIPTFKPQIRHEKAYYGIEEILDAVESEMKKPKETPKLLKDEKPSLKREEQTLKTKKLSQTPFDKDIAILYGEIQPPLEAQAEESESEFGSFSYTPVSPVETEVKEKLGEGEKKGKEIEEPKTPVGKQLTKAERAEIETELTTRVATPKAKEMLAPEYKLNISSEGNIIKYTIPTTGEGSKSEAGLPTKAFEGTVKLSGDYETNKTKSSFADISEFPQTMGKELSLKFFTSLLEKHDPDLVSKAEELIKMSGDKDTPSNRASNVKAYMNHLKILGYMKLNNIDLTKYKEIVGRILENRSAHFVKINE